MILILTEKTRHDREMLNYEIEKAIEMGLAIIVCYPRAQEPILNPYYYAGYWPKALQEGIENEEAQCIHIPFKKPLVFNALSRFSTHSEEVLSSLTHYNKEAYNNHFSIKWN